VPSPPNAPRPEWQQHAPPGRHPGRPGLAADTITAVQALDQAGHPRAQIARTLGISRSSVYRSLVGTGQEAPRGPRKLDLSIPDTFDEPLPEAEIATWEEDIFSEG